MNIHTVATITDDTTRDLLSLPGCPCGSGPVSRFIAVDGDLMLGCDDCYRACHTTPQVTHHARTSHGTCDHDATATDRAKCRAARRNGTAYVGDGYEAADDDAPELVQVVRGRKGTKLHAAAEDGTALCTGKLPTGAAIEDAPVEDIDCSRCRATQEMNE